MLIAAPAYWQTCVSSAKIEKSLSFDENNTDAIYFLGRCYQQKSDVEKAKSYYNKIVDNYPDSKRVSEAKRRLRELGE